MSFFAWKGSTRSESGEHTGRNLQDGLFQIASQACHILVQVNNTHNVSYGGSNNVKNIAYSKCSGKDGDSIGLATCSASRAPGSSVKSYTKYAKERGKDQDVVVLLPHRKSRTPLVKHKLSTVSENARLELNPSNCGHGGSVGGGSVGVGVGIGVGATNVNNNVADDDFELWDQSGFMLRHDVDDPLTSGKWGGAQGWCKPSCIPITVILILIVLVVLLPLLDHAADKYTLNNTSFDFDSSCMNGCNLSLVESLPIGMNYSNGNFFTVEDTYDTWLRLISMAQERIEIASFYWTLRREDVYPDDSAKQGEEIFASLLRAGRDRNIELTIAQNQPSRVSPNVDTELLAKKANAKVRSLNFAALLGGGVLHTKLWLIDRTHVYVGSANMDWRSLTQVKELGLLVLNCTCLANDYAKIFDVYWMVGQEGKVPPAWPDSLSTKINLKNPMKFTFMDNKYKTFIASSPPPFSPKGRTDDIDAILYSIEKAEKFIYIAVMDYFPLTIYTPKIRYWPIIDDALRTAAVERKVQVRLLISSWKHSRKSEIAFLKSLEDLTDSYAGVKIEVVGDLNVYTSIDIVDTHGHLLTEHIFQRRFIVPTNPDFDKIPFSRVNHNKYMVTETIAYIGTSNWSGDYFINTAGVGTVFETIGDQTMDNLRQQLENVFHRDWYSEYSYALNGSSQWSERATNTIVDDYYLRSSRYVLA